MCAVDWKNGGDSRLAARFLSTGGSDGAALCICGKGGAMRKEHSHEYYWVLIFAAALGMYLFRVLLIAGEGKEEPVVAVGRFSVDVTFSEEGEFLPPSYLEAARDPEFKEPFICLGYQEPGADRKAEARAEAEPELDPEHGTSSQPDPQAGTYRYWFQYAGERTPEVIYMKRPPVYVLREMEAVSAELSDELPVQMEYGDGTGWFDVTEVSCVQSGEGAYEIRIKADMLRDAYPGMVTLALGDAVLERKPEISGDERYAAALFGRDHGYSSDTFVFVYETENGSTYETVAGWMRTAVLSAGNPYEREQNAELEAESEGGSQVHLVPEA